MKLRRPCEHGRYDQHFAAAVWCPGGVFLPDDTLIASRAKIDWALVAVGDTDARYQTCQTFLAALSVRDDHE